VDRDHVPDDMPYLTSLIIKTVAQAD